MEGRTYLEVKLSRSFDIGISLDGGGSCARIDAEGGGEHWDSFACLCTLNLSKVCLSGSGEGTTLTLRRSRSCMRPASSACVSTNDEREM